MICEKCNKEHNGSFGSGRFCSRICANIRVHSIETKKKIGTRLKKPLYKKTCVFCKVKFETKIKNQKYHDRKCRFNDPEFLKNFSASLKGKTGGYRIGGGIGKSGWYKGFWCDSSWELAFVISHLDNGIKIKRNIKKFSYKFEDRKYNYIPDFVVRGTYTEIKGYKTKRFEAKKEFFPKNLKYKVLYEKDMQIYLDYVIKKYGKDFINLYEMRN